MQFDFCCVISHCFALCISTGWQSNTLLRSQYRNEWQGFKVENDAIFPTSKQNYRSNIWGYNRKLLPALILVWFDKDVLPSPFFVPSPFPPHFPFFSPIIFNIVVRFRNIYFRKVVYFMCSVWNQLVPHFMFMSHRIPESSIFFSLVICMFA